MEQARLKCYQHPNADAVGVCSECGRGVCSACATSAAGRLYCETDIEKGLARGRREDYANRKRPVTITLASILFVLYGVGELSLSIILMYLGVIPSSSLGMLKLITLGSSLNLIDTTVSLGPFIVGGILFVISTTGMVSGDWLWSRRRKGAVLGSIQIALGASLAVLLASFSNSSITFGVLSLVLGLNVVLAGLMIAGRRSLG